MRATLDTPLGPIWIAEAEGAIRRLGWGSGAVDGSTDLLRAAEAQLAAYFAGSLTRFTVPLRHGATGATGAVLDVLAAIPFGETRTYGEIGAEVGLPAQAVGRACGANPLPILIPCHRVTAAGHLGGFSAPGGIETKIRLLRHEGAAGLLL